jgi:hypothetical protein
MAKTSKTLIIDVIDKTLIIVKTLRNYGKIDKKYKKFPKW